jgi:transaldolase
MKATQKLHDLGQSIWLDNITRKLLSTGGLRRYIDELSITGLTSNPTIFEHAIKNGNDYDDAIKKKVEEGKSGERLFFELAIEDLTKAAELFRAVNERTSGLDGWVSLEVSPLLAYDTTATIAAAKELHSQANQPNVMIKIPGTPQGLPAIEEAIFAGVPINVTLLFSNEQYVAAAEAYMRGIERRIDAGMKANIPSVASISSADGTWRSMARFQIPLTISSASRLPGRSTAAIAACWARRAGCVLIIGARELSAYCGPAPGPRARRRRTSSTSRPWPRRSL